MRFMMLMYPSLGAETGAIPDASLVAEMRKYNEELVRAGVLIALDGLHPSAKGARIHFDGGKPRVQDGPFTEAKEIVGGYWMIQVRSKEEAVEWARRCPGREARFVELRQVFEMSDFPEDVRTAADSAALRAALDVTRGGT